MRSLAGGFRDHRDATLHVPAQNNLRNGFLVRIGDPRSNAS